MARIANVDIPNNKHVVISLTYIYGIGPSTALKLLNSCKIPLDKKVKDLEESEITRIREYITANVIVEGDLRSQISMNIKRLKDITCYRGLRHRRGLPVHGQRSKTNARTRKGAKRG